MTQQTCLLLQQAQQGDSRAEEELLTLHQGLCAGAIRRFNGLESEEDLLQLARIGLLKAIRRFDLQRGWEFSTYAVPLIFGEIRRFLRDNGTLHVSRTVRARCTLVEQARRRLAEQGLADPTTHQLAEACNLSPEDLLEALEAGAPLLSLESPVSEDGSPLGDFIADTELPQDTLLEKLSLSQAIERLPEQQQKVLRLRFGGGEPCRQQTVAETLGITQVQVSRLEKKALLTLRALL